MPLPTTREAPRSAPLLALEGISKSFGDVAVLQDISVELLAGEVHALMGENGAGKSTLIKIIGGIHAPNGGIVRLRGQAVRRLDARAAQAAGIYIVHQEFSTLPDLSVAENLFLGIEPQRLGFIDRVQMRQRTAEVMGDLGLRAGADALVGSLSIAERQLLEIGKALLRDASIIVFDEPTAALTQEEAALLIERLRTLRARGVAIVYISHRMEEVFQLADRISVLKDGRLVVTRPSTELSERDVVRHMVGRELSDIFPGKAGRAAGAAAMQAYGVSLAPKLKPCDFTLHYGEILGIAGMAGSGRTTLAHCLFGVLARDGGRIELDGHALPESSPTVLLALGVVYLTEDRRVSGLFLGHSVAHNVTAASLGKHTRRGWINGASELAAARERTAQLNVRARNEHTAVVNLSGGNQQKVLLARLLELEPKVLILDEPTRGVDVGAKAEIYRLIDTLCRRGTAVLMISSELIEVVGLSDRVIVMHSGGIAATLAGDEVSERHIMDFAARKSAVRTESVHG